MAISNLGTEASAIYAGTRTQSPPTFRCSLSLTLRRCTRADLPNLEWLGMFRHDRHIIEAAYGAQLKGTGDMLLLDATGFPVAQVWIDYLRPDPGSPPCLWALRVFPFLGGRGIGSWLLRASEQYLWRRGHARVEPCVDLRNERALHFYQRLGYRAAERKPGAPAGGADVGTTRLLQKDLRGAGAHAFSTERPPPRSCWRQPGTTEPYGQWNESRPSELDGVPLPEASNAT